MKPKMIAYKCLYLQPSVYEYLNRETDLQFFKNPGEISEVRTIGRSIIKEAEILWMPLGHPPPDIGRHGFPNLKIVVSNTTSSAHIPEEFKENVKVITLEDDHEFLVGIKATAEHTWGLIHAIHRRIPAAHYDACKGTWDRRRWPSPKMLCNMTLGIIGYGRIGQIVAGIGHSIMKDVQWYDPEHPKRHYFPPFGSAQPYQSITLNGILKDSDVLAICCASTAFTRGMIDSMALRLMRRGAILVNTARGEVINETALLAALHQGWIRGAALDVVYNDTDHRHAHDWQYSKIRKYARTHDNLILTPHIAGSTVDAWEATEMRVAQRAVEAYHNG
jgi:D-3-phosphoglycerate dehydrogenase